MIKISLKFKVLGYENKRQVKEDKEIEFTQLQTFMVVKGKIKKFTLKVNKLLKDDELNNLIDKTIIANSEDNKLLEIGDFDKVYVCDSFEVCKDSLKDGISIEVNHSITIQVSNVLVKDQDTIIQSLMRIENSIKLIDIKIKNNKLNAKDLMGKDVSIENINIVNFNYKTYYSSETLPTIL